VSTLVHTATRCRALAAASLAVAAAGCELREITIADADDVVVAEFVLIAGAPRQSGMLHRTLGSDSSRVPATGASVRIVAADGGELELSAAPPDFCFIDGSDDDGAPACYASTRTVLPGSFVVPGETYTLRIRLADGRELTGTTTVPAPFQLRRPAASACALPPGQPLDIVWTMSPTAWLYAAETELNGLRAALAARGIDVEREPLRLFGLALSNTDTTIAFPAEFGVFDRFDPDLTETLAAIQTGLPPGIDADVVIAAADRNYVNWERGGNFNPSGFVRVPSVFGDGTGVFGAVLPRTFQLTTHPNPALPAC
jgi:hypothetical protein